LTTSRTGPDQPPSDEELWSAYVGGDPRASGEAFIGIYRRYRDTMRSTMEAAGLSGREAERRVGAVFMRALDANDGRVLPLRVRLEEAARAVAADPDWSSVS
jgi:hypothetical protein